MCRYSSHPVWYYQFSYIGQHSHYEDPISKKPVGEQRSTYITPYRIVFL